MREIGVFATSLGWAEDGEEIAGTWHGKAVARLVHSQTQALASNQTCRGSGTDSCACIGRIRCPMTWPDRKTFRDEGRPDHSLADLARLNIQIDPDIDGFAKTLTACRSTKRLAWNSRGGCMYRRVPAPTCPAYGGPADNALLLGGARSAVFATFLSTATAAKERGDVAEAEPESSAEDEPVRGRGRPRTSCADSRGDGPDQLEIRSANRRAGRPPDRMPWALKSEIGRRPEPTAGRTRRLGAYYSFRYPLRAPQEISHTQLTGRPCVCG